MKISIYFAIVFLLLSSCRDYVLLTPAPEAQEVEDLNHAATTSVANINVTVQARAWPYTTAIKSEVTPLRILIENNSTHTLRIRYSDFSLVTARGENFSALPPYAIEGTIEEPVRVEPYPGAVAPRFRHRDFMIAPYYAPHYEGITPFDGPYFYDPFYYERYYTYLREVELPTIEMLQEALPDGVIEPGGMIDGFIYFEPITADVFSVNFRMVLADAREGEVFGIIQIPFNVR
jgi:hypothetical protein